MAEGVTSNHHRRRMAAAMAGGAPVKPPHYVAFGDGGHTEDRKAKPASADALGLANELIRKPVGPLSQEDPYSVTAVGRLEKADLVGVDVSEAALLDEDGNLIGLRNFRPKPKESDESYAVKIKLRY